MHLDITDTSGSIVGAKLLPVRNEGGHPVARGEVHAPSWGSLLLTFFALGHDSKAPSGERLGLVTSTQSLAVRPDRELEVVLEGVPDTVRPGENLKVHASVRTREGAPAEVEVGAALVDAAVLAMKDPLEITPMDKFYNPELRSMATTGAKMSTWPVVTRNWGDRTVDVALPPFPWLEGGDIIECRRYWDEQDWKASGESNIGVGGLGLVGSAVGAGSGYGRGPGRSDISIRTRFPATALWAPDLRGTGGVDIAGTLPDTIGEQELIVVASDKHGGVGIARRTIEVSAPLVTQTSLPAVAIVGEQINVPVAVHNRTGRDAKFTVSVAGTGAGSTGSISVGDGNRGTLALPWRPAALGAMKLSVRAVGGGHDDRVERRVPVIPRGVVFFDRAAGVTKGGRPAVVEFTIDAAAAGNDVHLEVAFSAVTTAMAGLAELAREVGDDPWTLASDLASAVVLLDIVRRHGLKTKKTEDLRAQVMAATAMLRRLQRADGHFSYWRNGKASPYVTVRVLEGLLEAKRSGFPAADETISKAARAVAVGLTKGALASVDAIGWWEGTVNEVRLGVTAEIFDVLSQVPTKQRTKAVTQALAVLSHRFAALLASGNVDPLVGGRAASALLRRGKLSPEQALEVAELLVARRHEGHWEPTWFHAYGGRLEATAAVLELLRAADPKGHRIEKRDALQWILATRSSWGTWHNRSGSVAALRAIRAAGAAPEETPATVRVRLDGRLVHEVNVDPADPVGSTLSLVHLDLGKNLAKGRHRVEVSYDGNLRPVATVTSRGWFAGRENRANGRALRLQADGSHHVAAGDPTRLTVVATGKRLSGATIVVSPSGLLEVDVAGLAQKVGRGAEIADVRSTARGTELVVAPGVNALQVAIPLRAIRSGDGQLPSVGIEDREGHRALVTAPGPIVVD